ncbi:MAG: 16S rRNA (cytidine(1402)-2'-O)-methyltransferase [Candidatus Berkiellales bacterium]
MFHRMGKLYVVATPIGNLNDLSPRAQEILSHVTWIAAEDTRHSKGLLQHFGITTTLISYHEHNEQERASQLIEGLLKGEEGALISDAGTPLISDPGYTLVKKALQANIPVIPIPGPCALIAALSVSGLPTDKFFFEGFLPAKKEMRRQRLKELIDFDHTMIFFEAPHRVNEMMEELVASWGPDREATLMRELTKKFESVYFSTLQGILMSIQNGTIPLKGEFILVVKGSKRQLTQTESQQEMERVLKILLAEMSLKQAVLIAEKLTSLPKNALYDCAISLQRL